MKGVSGFPTPSEEMWEVIVERTLRHEGGYTEDPDDAGNWTGGKIGEGELKGTNWGISARQYPDLDIKALTREAAIQIYKRDYYDPLALPTIWPIQVRWKLFDIAVNQGMSIAQKFREEIKEQPSIYRLVELQMRRYVDVTVNKPSNLKFLKGWTSRAFDTGRDLV